MLMSWPGSLVVSCAMAIAIAIGVAAPASGAAVGACHVSPIVADLGRSVRFYRDLLGLELAAAPQPGPLPWDTTRELLDLHGLPNARLRYASLRIPGVRCGIEPAEFDRVDRKPVRRRMQDPGAVTLILLVRDIDAAFARLKAAGVPVATTGGAPVMPSPTSKTRAVIVEDPDGHFVELAQLEPPPSTTVPASSNVFDIRFRITVGALEPAVQYYRDHLGISGKPGAFAKSTGVMAMMGLPDTAEYRMSVTPIPGSTLIFELLELRGLEAATVRTRIQDPGAYRLQLNVDDIDATIAALGSVGSRVISTGGTPVSMTPGRPRRVAVVPDPNGLFLVLQQGPLP
jgi:catechol 2,3-dioxygenase-like lactoylglutathione lyase family enzyme